MYPGNFRRENPESANKHRINLIEKKRGEERNKGKHGDDSSIYKIRFGYSVIRHVLNSRNNNFFIFLQILYIPWNRQKRKYFYRFVIKTILYTVKNALQY